MKQQADETNDGNVPEISPTLVAHLSLFIFYVCTFVCFCFWIMFLLL